MIESAKRCPYCGAELDIGGQWYSCGLWPLTCEQRRTYTCLRNELKRLREQTVPREVADRLAALLIRYRDATPVNYQSLGIMDEVTYALANYRVETLPMNDRPKYHPWSWCRDLLSQGGDIYHDRMPGGYEIYSARLDAAARERADELKAHCVPREPADRLADLLSELLDAYAAERYDRGAKSVTQLEDEATLAIVAYREAARR